MVEYQKRLQGDTAVFFLQGVICMSETAELRKILWDCLMQDGVKCMIVDLSGVTAMSSSTISLLVGAQSMALKTKGRLMLTGLSREALSYLEQFNLHHYFTIRATVGQAMEQEEAPRVAGH